MLGDARKLRVPEYTRATLTLYRKWISVTAPFDSKAERRLDPQRDISTARAAVSSIDRIIVTLVAEAFLANIRQVGCVVKTSATRPELRRRSGGAALTLEPQIEPPPVRQLPPDPLHRAVVEILEP